MRAHERDVDDRRRRCLYRAAMGIGLVATWVALAGVPLGSARAEPDYPNRPVRVFIPYGPGGVADVTMRLLAQKLDRGDQAAVRDREPPGRRRTAGRQGRARFSGGRIHARGRGKRPGDRRVAVQEPPLQSAHRLHACIDHGTVRDAPCRQRGLALPHPAGRGRRRAQESGQAQFRRHQSRQHAEPVGPSVQADERRRRHHHSLQDDARISSPRSCAATSTSASTTYAGFQSATQRQQDQDRRDLGRGARSAACATCRPRRRAASRTTS